MLYTHHCTFTHSVFAKLRLLGPAQHLNTIIEFPVSILYVYVFFTVYIILYLNLHVSSVCLFFLVTSRSRQTRQAPTESDVTPAT